MALVTLSYLSVFSTDRIPLRGLFYFSDILLEIAINNLVDELQNPTLTLATTGTTSSGKSTLVNLLCGAEIVPVAVSEMSAGAVTIEYSELKSSQDDVIFEVENDINAFEEYLRAAIFEAAGFESYCIQELKGLIDSFREKQGTWTGIANNEWVQENPLLLAEIPPELRSQESNLEVSDRLRQLSTALKNTRMQEVRRRSPHFDKLSDHRRHRIL
ncbi:dynamin family protein [Nostoc sp. CHAB 5784]|uniref:dynamin family protein n=1 Tax=Nostoc mirabile TaxID=2907820 RepID=UPI001E28E414|nr:dynamin family protein [Nostoc mirabile]MCC5667592.1 dynamin family protein [Nostoc mirabile CHAB5784]